MWKKVRIVLEMNVLFTEQLYEIDRSCRAVSENWWADSVAALAMFPTVRDCHNAGCILNKGTRWYFNIDKKSWTSENTPGYAYIELQTTANVVSGVKVRDMVWTHRELYWKQLLEGHLDISLSLCLIDSNLYKHGANVS